MQWLHDFLHQPIKVFWVSISIAICSVILNGSFFHLWSLYREEDAMLERINKANKVGHELEQKIYQAQQPQFIERRAMDQLDLVKEGDLLFVFAEDELRPDSLSAH